MLIHFFPCSVILLLYVQSVVAWNNTLKYFIDTPSLVYVIDNEYVFLTALLFLNVNIKCSFL